MKLEIALFAFGLILGTFFSWYFTRRYYKKTKKDSEKFMLSLCSILGERAFSQLKRSITTEQKADKVLRELWLFLGQRYGDDFMKFRCHFCGSSNIKAQIISNGESEADIPYCGDCGKELY